MNQLNENQNINRIGLAVWRTQTAERAKKSWLASILLRQNSRILSRFIHFYRRLRAQPRRIRRVIMAKTATTLVGASLLLALSSTPTYAATINVDGTTCTLIDAIAAANTDTATGGCIAGSGADTIVLSSGSTLTLYGPTGLPTISSEITISGNGAIIEADVSASSFPLMEVDNSGNLTLNDLTLRNSQGNGLYSFGGSVVVNDSTISGNAINGIESSMYSSIVINNSNFTGNYGYGVSAGFGDLTINSSVFSGNGAGVGGFSETVEINDSTITGNTGAGVSTYEGPLTIDNTILTNNAGGGVYASGGAGRFDVIISNSTISGNTGNGGFSGFYADITIENSSISNNSNAFRGGGVHTGRNFTLTINNSTISNNTAFDKGGGVFNGEGDFTINNSTISGNSANAGGGVFNYLGFSTINDSTITGNTANIGGGVYGYYDPITLNRTLISGNTAPTGREAYMQYAYSPADNYNLFGYDGDAGVSGFTPGPTDIVPGIGIQVSDILDTTLQNNGGDTDTHALVPGSPAIDAVSAGSCTAATDQRGVSRPQGSDCDIGAFELEVVQNQPPTAEADGPYSVDEGSSVPLDGSNSSDPDVGDSLTYEWDLDYDGLTFDVDATGSTPTFDASNLDGPTDSRTVALRVTDNAGVSDIDTADVTINNVAPVPGAIAAPIAPIELGTPVNVSASFTDAGVPDTHTAEWDWGDNTTSPGTVSSSTVTGNHNYAEPGVYTITLTVTDDDGGIGTSVFEFVVVYDPDGGFVTGGGWINSQAGAYYDDPSLSGTANFGFVSKYKKNANVPTGNTEFNFQIANLNFHSDTYDWLVVNQGGTNAQFKGSGTINGGLAPSGELFKFMIWATDNDPGGDDTFRIKLWWDDNGSEVIVYDNGSDQPIGGGNIKVHKGK